MKKRIRAEYRQIREAVYAALGPAGRRKFLRRGKWIRRKLRKDRDP